MSNNMINISHAPHVRDGRSTQYIMTCVFLALVPAAAVGVWAYGVHALLVILASVATAVLSEYLFDRLAHKDTKGSLDGSAAVTGLLLALSISPDTPLYAPVIGALFAMVVVKGCFGGLGKNFLNPALAARCFLLISFPNAMTLFKVDGISSATPAAQLLSGKAVNVTSMFLGTSNSVIGSSILALLIGGMILWSMDIIHGHVCFSVLGGFSAFLLLFGGQGFDLSYVAANICCGGVVMGAFFMATDYVTSPVSRLGQTLYGITIGVLGGLFRVFGSSADSFSYSILIGNLLTPLFDMYIFPKPFAYRKKEVDIRNHVEKKPLSERIPKSVVVIVVITLIAGFALGGAYKLTEPTIREQKEKAAWASYQTVVPDAVSFTSIPEAAGVTSGRTTIKEAVKGLDAAGAAAGYAIAVTSSEGYEGDITLSVGISTSGVINSISFTELNETPGKGMLAAEPEFKDQFNNLSAKSLSLGKEIDGMSGATITSKAVVNAVNTALDFFHNSIKGE